MPAERVGAHQKHLGVSPERKALLGGRTIERKIKLYLRQNADALLLRRSISIFSRVVTKVE